MIRLISIIKLNPHIAPVNCCVICRCMSWQGNSINKQKVLILEERPVTHFSLYKVMVKATSLSSAQKKSCG